MASQQNNDKNRKSEAQKSFEEADNAGRFAGEDTDAKVARAQGMGNIRQDTNSGKQERDGSGDRSGSNLEVNQANVGDASSVSDEATQKLSDRARSVNKANEGARQNRDDVRNDDRDEINNDELGKH